MKFCQTGIATMVRHTRMPAPTRVKNLTNAELKRELKARNIRWDKRSKKPELLKLLQNGGGLRDQTPKTPITGDDTLSGFSAGSDNPPGQNTVVPAEGRYDTGVYIRGTSHRAAANIAPSQNYGITQPGISHPTLTGLDDPDPHTTDAPDCRIDQPGIPEFTTANDTGGPGQELAPRQQSPLSPHLPWSPNQHLAADQPQLPATHNLELVRSLETALAHLRSMDPALAARPVPATVATATAPGYTLHTALGQPETGFYSTPVPIWNAAQTIKPIQQAMGAMSHQSVFGGACDGTPEYGIGRTIQGSTPEVQRLDAIGSNQPLPSTIRCDVRLRNATQFFINNALSQNTYKSYSSGIKSFLLFTAMYNVNRMPNNLPVCNEEILCAFVTHCVVSQKLSYSTIKSYLAGIRYHYIVTCASNPLQQLNGEPLHKLALLLRGVKKSTPSTHRNTRQPMTGRMLSLICTRLTQGLFGIHVDKLLKAVCLTAYFGLLRCGEFTTYTDRFDPNVNLCLNDLNFKHDHANITIKVSKTDPFRKGCTLMLFKNNSSLCPVNALHEYLQIRNCITVVPHTPLFLMGDSKPLSRRIFLHLLHKACEASGIQDDNVSGHSFRIGFATDSSMIDTPDHLIKTLGRWQSDCYRTYIRTPKELIRNTQRKLAAVAIARSR